VLQDTHGSRAFAQRRRRLGYVETGNQPEEKDLGLCGRKLGDDGDGLVGGFGLNDQPGWIVPGHPVGQVGDRDDPLLVEPSIPVEEAVTGD
jgi:hypothetical protein